MMKHLNNYFFGEEEISLSDALWYYGSYAIIGILTLIAIVPVIF